MGWEPIVARRFKGVGGWVGGGHHFSPHSGVELLGLPACVPGVFTVFFGTCALEGEVSLQFSFPECERKGAWGWPSVGCHGSPTPKPYRVSLVKGGISP